MIILSILMCTIPERKEKFDSLKKEVSRQVHELERNHASLGSVEINWSMSKAFLNGGKSIGTRRGELLLLSDGKYLCFLDDDEDIAPNYVETLVRLCQLDADVVTFRNLTKTDNYWTVVDMSLKNKVNEEATPDRIVKRLPWHICPVKSEYAKLYEFEDSNYGEDFQWMSKVLTRCESEAHTDAIIHCYNHSSKLSESDKIIKAGYV